ncbi:MAG: GNAT family N-acetyltransferase [Candidatus Lokiarchaeota archaeon]|nr:GNAT family N-acetyltransferase [Candidatus Lokiarchaeota archaeon]
MLRIRKMHIDEISFALEQTKNEGWTDIYDDWYAFITYNPNAAFVAEINNHLVGMVSAVAYDKFGFIGGLIVTNQHRGNGIGTHLMSFAISYLEKLKVPLIMLDGVADAVPLYESLGFQVFCKSLRFKTKIEGHRSCNVRQMEKEDQSIVYSLDYSAFNANRTHFLQNIFENFPELCLVAERNKEIVGYAMGSKRANVVRLGPIVCSEKSELVIDLLKHFGSLVREKVRVGVLETNRQAISILESVGFNLSSYSFRMGRGDHTYFSDSPFQYAIGSPAKG